MKHFFAAALVFFILNTTHAQLASWTLVNAKITFNEKWSFVGEAQLRSYQFYNEFFYYEGKGGIQCQLEKNFSMLVGAGKYETYSHGGNFKSPKVNDETRTWIQFVLNQKLTRLKFEHRYRAEQRFTSAGYRNRFRYRLGCFVPLNKKTFEPGTAFLFLFNEVFFTNKAPYFERNRASAGAGYQFSKIFTLQAAFLNQYDYTLTSDVSRNFLQMSLLFDLKPTFKTEHPRSGID